jgi:xanthine dehydrogenase accessory factor
MVVTESQCFGTIGGGSLEYKTTNQARELLRNGGTHKPKQHIQTYILGSDVSQCCGGVCTVYLETLPPVDYPWVGRLLSNRNTEHCVLVTFLDPSESTSEVSKIIVSKCESKGRLSTEQMIAESHARTLLNSPGRSKGNLQLVYRNSEDVTPAYMLDLYTPNNFQLIVFGAGHVGKAVIHVMSELPCQITWIDTRSEMFPQSLPHNVEKIITEAHGHIIANAKTNTFFLVMTHSHPLDLSLCEQILKRNDFAYLGLIGSKIKRKRFEKRLLEADCQPEAVERLICPIGISRVSGKQPGVIAVSVAAQILQQWNTMASNPALSPYF